MKTPPLKKSLGGSYVHSTNGAKNVTAEVGLDL